MRTGQFVLAGEPVGVMGREGRPIPMDEATASVPQTDARDAGGPVLYIELRKDSTPIDGRGWWAGSDKAKDSG